MPMIFFDSIEIGWICYLVSCYDRSMIVDINEISCHKLYSACISTTSKPIFTN